jgi:hypothetical protein
MAPLPPNVAKEPLGRCMPEAQKALLLKSIAVAVRVLMSQTEAHAGWPLIWTELPSTLSMM